MVSSWQGGEFCDAEVDCGGVRFAAHRVVLAACSAPLAQAFNQRLKQKRGGDTAVDLFGICGLGGGASESVGQLLEWVYCGEVGVRGQPALLRLLEAAAALQVLTLVQQAEAVLCHQLYLCAEGGGYPEGCLEAWAAAERLALPRLAAAARAAAARDFERLSTSDGFGLLPPSRLQELLKEAQAQEAEGVHFHNGGGQSTSSGGGRGRRGEAPSQSPVISGVVHWLEAQSQSPSQSQSPATSTAIATSFSPPPPLLFCRGHHQP